MAQLVTLKPCDRCDAGLNLGDVPCAETFCIVPHGGEQPCLEYTEVDVTYDEGREPLTTSREQDKTSGAEGGLRNQ